MSGGVFTQSPWLWTLLWQSTACLALGLGGSLVLWRRPARAHQVLLLAIVAAAGIPLLGHIVKLNQWGLFVAERTVPARKYDPVSPMVSDRHDPQRVPTIRPTMEQAPAGNHPAPAGVPAARFAGPRLFVALWLVASSILLLRLGVRFLSGLILVGRAHTVEEQVILEGIETARKRLRAQIRVAVRRSSRADSPAIWCWGRPLVLLIPSDTSGSRGQLDWASIVCHELAHWKRRDHVSGLFVEVLACLLPWQLLLWWARYRLVRLSEEACDDWVVACGCPGSDYARTLLDLVARRRPAWAPSVVSSGKPLAERIRRIVRDGGSNPRPGLRWSLAAAVLAACVTLGLAFAQTRPAAPDIPAQTVTNEAESSIPVPTEDLTPQDTAPPWPIPADSVRLRLLDPNGAPVAGAKAGPNVGVREDLFGGILLWGVGGISDERGEVVLDLRGIFQADRDRRVFYILHEERKLGALQPVTQADAGRTLEVQLRPVCRVHGTLSSPRLPASMPLRSTSTEACLEGIPVIEHNSQKQKFEFPLPPGGYTVGIRGKGYEDEPVVVAPANPATLALRVADGDRDLDLGNIELRPAKLATLIGHPAPELGPITAWKNGAPVTLAQLHGRVVILYLAGDYPYVAGELATLAKFQDAFGDKGLTILAVYGGISLQELEDKWPGYDQKLRRIDDVPFRIAIDGSAPTANEATGGRRLGVTYEKYGVSRPTAILIDPQGNVVGEYPQGYDEGIIRRMLGLSGPTAASSAWRKRFDELYRLEEGQVLKRVAPPFIPERRDYYNNEPILWVSDLPGPPPCFILHWDGARYRETAGFAQPLDLGLALEHVLGFSRYNYDGPDALLSLGLPGDWLVRDDAPQPVKLQALEQLIARELGRKVRFERRLVTRPALVATGRFRFHPVYASARVCVFSGTSWATNDEHDDTREDSARSTREFVRKLGDALHLPVVDKTDNTADISIPFYISLGQALPEAGDSGQRTQGLPSLLANVGAQTELQLEIREEPIEVWFAQEDGSSR